MPPRKQQPAEPPDPVVFGPPMEPEQGPQPAPPPKPRRRRPPEPGEREKGVLHDLSMLPEHLRRGGIAAGAIGLARDLDGGIVMGRDAASHQREIRQSITQLREWAPGAAADDKTDEVRERRERRLGQASGG